MPENLSVLFVHDRDEACAPIVRALAEEGYAVTSRRVADIPELRDALLASRWDIVLGACDLAPAGPLEILAACESSPGAGPCILMGDASQDGLALRCLEAGARDCVPPVPLRRLLLVIRRELRYQEQLRQLHAAQAAARAATEQLEHHLENIPLALIEWNNEFCISKWSRRAEEMFGWTAEEMIGRPWKSWRWVHDDDLEQVIGVVEKLIRGDERSNLNYNRNYTKDGRVLHLQWYNSALIDEQGVLQSILTFAQDITGRVQAEQALRKSEDLLSNTQRIAEIGGWELGSEPNEVRWTEEVYRIHEVPLDYRPTVEEALAFYADEGRPVIAKAVEQLVERGIPYDLELPFVTARGRRIWVRTQGKREELPDGTTRFYGAFQNITARREAEMALRESERRYRELLDSLEVGVCLYTPAGEVALSNPKAIEILGDPALPLLLRPCTADNGAYLVDEEGQPLPPEEYPVRLAIALVRPIRNQVFGIVQGGVETQRWILLSAFPHLDEEHTLQRVLVSFTDITRRRTDENERHLLELQMQQAQKMESLGLLAGGIAHDFNNMLLAVLGNADLALATLPAGLPGREYIADIVHGAQRASDLCRQLLAYAGRGRFTVETVRLDQVAEEMAHLLEVSVSKNARLRFEFDPGGPAVEADVTQLRQIIMNLITNASDALDNRPGDITLRTGRTACGADYLAGTYLDDGLPSGNYAYIEVEDTGAGMDAETQARIFDPFFTSKAAGHGLGLSTVLGIVRSHRGAIDIQSAPGCGARIRVLLPAGGAPASLESPANSAEHGARLAGTVLFVDDEAAIRDLGKRILERAGLEVLLAEDGQEAVEVFERAQDRIGLVVLDLVMPRMNGREAFRALRELRPGLPIILSSAYSEQEVVEGLEAGNARFIQKPYRAHDLVALVRESLAPGS